VEGIYEQDLSEAPPSKFGTHCQTAKDHCGARIRRSSHCAPRPMVEEAPSLRRKGG
jgi:hypothetical protein